MSRRSAGVPITTLSSTASSRVERAAYLFRDEYIFDLERALVAETPQLGHATYIFSKPRSIDGFLATYTQITKDDIRHNRDNVATRLGFRWRVIHGVEPGPHYSAEWTETGRILDRSEEGFRSWTAAVC
jgi:hypothetical protein